jgi:hypothetical protein
MTYERKNKTHERCIGDAEVDHSYVYVYIEAIRTRNILANAVQLAVCGGGCRIIKDTSCQSSTTIILKHDIDEVRL